MTDGERDLTREIEADARPTGGDRRPCLVCGDAEADVLCEACLREICKGCVAETDGEGGRTLYWCWSCSDAGRTPERK